MDQNIDQQLYHLRALLLKLQEQLIARDQADKMRRAEVSKILFDLDKKMDDPEALLRALLAVAALFQ